MHTWKNCQYCYRYRSWKNLFSFSNCELTKYFYLQTMEYFTQTTKYLWSTFANVFFLIILNYWLLLTYQQHIHLFQSKSYTKIMDDNNMKPTVSAILQCSHFHGLAKSINTYISCNIPSITGSHHIKLKYEARL